MDNIFHVVIICFFLTFLFIAFVAFFFLKHQKKIYSHTIEVNRINSIYEKELLKTKLLVQEETFQHISRDIHDNIGQKLTLARLFLNTINFTNTENVHSNVKQSAEVISQCLSDLRDISRSLSTEQILNNGLYKALENEVNLINRSGVLKIKLNMTGDFDFIQAEKEILVFRIIQECLSNTIKHAQATEITIELSSTDSLKTICVSDNGIGFNQEEITNSNGLNNIQSRVNAIGGVLCISSVHQKGTVITIKIPIDEQQEV